MTDQLPGGPFSGGQRHNRRVNLKTITISSGNKKESKAVSETGRQVGVILGGSVTLSGGVAGGAQMMRRSRQAGGGGRAPGGHRGHRGHRP